VLLTKTYYLQLNYLNLQNFLEQTLNLYLLVLNQAV
jgi:hypothetical protein